MAPEASELRRCEAHGLIYDPRLRGGCVLCRREARSAPPTGRARTRAFVPALLALTLLAALGLTYAMRQEPRAPVLAPALPASATAEKPREPALGALHPLVPSMWAEVVVDFVVADAKQAGVQALLVRGIDVYVPRAAVLDIEQGKLTGVRPSADDVHLATVQVSASLARYSATFLERAGFRHLVLISKLKHKGVEPGAFAMTPAGAMIANPSALTSDDSVQHEFFHFVDYRLHGFPAQSEEWLRHNPAGARYGQGGREMAARNRGATRALLQPLRDVPGFVTRYAQADATEDRAEVFALLVAHPQTAAELASADPFIAAKMQFMLTLLDRIEPGSASALGLRSLPLSAGR